MAIFSFQKRLNSAQSVDTLSQHLSDTAKHLRDQNTIVYKGSTEPQAIQNAGFGLNLKQGVLGLPLVFASGGLKATEAGTQIDVRYNPSQALSQWGALPLLGALAWLNFAIFTRAKEASFLDAALIPGGLLLLLVVVGFVLFRVEGRRLHGIVKQLVGEQASPNFALEDPQDAEDDADNEDDEFDPTAAFR